MAELEELEQEELDKNLLEISGPETVPLPNVPSITLPSKPSEYFLPRHDIPLSHVVASAWVLSLPRIESHGRSVLMATETTSPVFS